MLKIDVRDNLAEVTKGLDDLARRQIPFAAARALTSTGRGLRAELGGTMTSVFASVSPFVANSPFSTVATKNSLETTVGIRDQNRGRASPADYLREHFSGGARGHKPMERAMQAVGALPHGWRAVPGAGMKLDRNGNPNRKQIAEILGALKSGFRVHSGKRRRAQQATYFVVDAKRSDKRTAHLEPGIYRRTDTAKGSTLQAVFAFVSQAHYDKVIDLPRLAAVVVRKEFEGHFATALTQAIKTAH